MLAGAVAILGYMDTVKMVQRLVGLAAVVLLLVAVANLMPPTAIVRSWSTDLTAIAINVAMMA